MGKHGSRLLRRSAHPNAPPVVAAGDRLEDDRPAPFPGAGAHVHLRHLNPLPPDLAARTAEDIMLPLAFTLDEHATVAHAAAMMVQEDLHHVMIVSTGGFLVGVVSSHDIVRWVIANDELAGSVKAPRSALASLYE